MISLFDFDDEEMIHAKSGQWWVDNPQRALANNSAMALRHRITRRQFDQFMGRVEESGAGEPGIYFGNDPNSLTNPSLRRGTKIITDKGVFPIEQLEGKDFKVKNLHGQLAPAKCFLSGRNQPLYKITLKGGHTYYATKEHKWPIQTAYGWKKKETHEIEVGDLLPNLRQNSLFDGTLGDYKDGLLVGWLYGDGWWLQRKDNGAYQYGIVVSKADEKYGMFELIKSVLHEKICSSGRPVTFSDRGSCWECNFQRASAHEYFAQFGVGKKEDGLPSKIWTECSEEFRKGFVDGLISADGSVDARSQMFFTSSRAKLAYELSELLGFYGVRSSVSYSKVKNARFPNGIAYDRTYDRYTVFFGEASSVLHFTNVFHISHEKKRARLLEYARRDNLDCVDVLGTIKVMSVELTDLREDVWDITVYDDTHCFQLPHCVTGNCAEASVNQNFCNLTTFNFSVIESQQDLRDFARAAAFLGTLQAGYTDYHYLRPVWQERTEKEALLGVSMTGIARSDFGRFDLRDAAQQVIATNQQVAGKIGINSAYRLTVNKPEGTSSAVLQTSSGVHAWHDRYFIRRTRYSADSPLVRHLRETLPDAVEADRRDPSLAVVSLPCRAPDNAITRHEPMDQLLDRIHRCSTEWVREGHRKGHNGHSVSATVSVKPDQWGQLRDWMWSHRYQYNGLSVLPYDGGTYDQAPFETITPAQYFAHAQRLPETLALHRVTEVDDATEHSQEVACAGGACTI